MAVKDELQNNHVGAICCGTVASIMALEKERRGGVWTMLTLTRMTIFRIITIFIVVWNSMMTCMGGPWERKEL